MAAEMNLFDVKRIKWYKYMDNTIENVNLSAIEFLNGKTVKFAFNAASREGGSRGSLICKNILKLNMEYDNDNDVSMPYFVLDVWVKKLSEEELTDALMYYKYGFNGDIERLKKNVCYLMNIVGSEVSIEILCESFELKN
ncbi:MAG: hypothetical protein IJR45_06685 [Firmicutes bacterium]|nr:hypothetical protein [Bacillota bacterium]